MGVSAFGVWSCPREATPLHRYVTAVPGDERPLRRPRGAPARLESLEVGHVRLIATFEGMRGAGVLEITE